MLIDSTSHRGYVTLYPAATTDVSDVTLYELIGRRFVELGRPTLTPVPGNTEYGQLQTGVARDVTRWTCDRRSRTFVATGTGRDGFEYDAETVRTPPCTNRLTLQTRPGGVTLTDTWALGGLSASLCTPRACRRLTLPRGRTVLSQSLPLRRGDPVTLYTRYQRITRRVGARTGGGAVILTTGDSMMENLDAVLEDHLARRADVVSDIKVGSALSSDFVVNFRALAREQVRRLHPSAVVVFLGTNDGSTIDGVPCCSQAWIDRYAQRARTVMRTYAQDGAGTVIWVTVPVARDPQRRLANIAVNAALRAAAQSVPGVRIVPADAIFTPDNTFRPEYRAADGIHLTVAGARIAARYVEAVLRRTGIVR